MGPQIGTVVETLCSLQGAQFFGISRGGGLGFGLAGTGFGLDWSTGALRVGAGRWMVSGLGGCVGRVSAVAGRGVGFGAVTTGLGGRVAAAVLGAGCRA